MYKFAGVICFELKKIPGLKIFIWYSFLKEDRPIESLKNPSGIPS